MICFKNCGNTIFLFFYLSSSPVFKGLFWWFNFRVCLGSYFMLFSAAMTAGYLPGKEAMIHSHLMTPEGKPLGISPIIARQDLGAYSSKHVLLHLLAHTTDLLHLSFLFLCLRNSVCFVVQELLPR